MREGCEGLLEGAEMRLSSEGMARERWGCSWVDGHCRGEGRCRGGTGRRDAGRCVGGEGSRGTVVNENDRWMWAGKASGTAMGHLGCRMGGRM